MVLLIGLMRTYNPIVANNLAMLSWIKEINEIKDLGSKGQGKGGTGIFEDVTQITQI